ncbi:MAG: ArsA family ATPase [Solirubrobacterales bacterium]|nr:ArsA family ATPase [Solirubrobacterales bacterium]
MSPLPLLEHRLIFVTGKGGVGRTTVARALGLIAARAGQRVIIAELTPASQAPDSRAGGIAEVKLAPGLFTITIDPQAAMEEYLRVKAGALGSALAASRIFGALAMATPGMRELLAIGKVWELAQVQRIRERAAPYDVVIVDAPATGHGVAALRTPRTFAEIARVGPIARQASTIAATIADPEFTAVVGVAQPEELPVSETLSLARALEKDHLRLAYVITNMCYPERFSEAEIARLESARQDAGTLTDAPLRAAISEGRRAAAQRPYLERLRAAFGERLVTLPYLFSAEPDIRSLADRLGTQL